MINRAELAGALQHYVMLIVVTCPLSSDLGELRKLVLVSSAE
jgi:hypothetical protein